MRKSKIYLDTSAISHLNAPDTPEKMASTLKFWEVAKTSAYDVYISDVTIAEMMRCPEPKRSILLDRMDEIKYTVIVVDAEIDNVAQKFVENGILMPASLDDCRHMACAIVRRCDYIISWNFKHIVNVRAIKGVKVVSVLTGYDEVAICTPEFLTEGD
jgi:predicted nucleic acid-binding protein